MNSRTLRRKPVTIANSRWATYAVAGAATSLAGLATAEAEIHYSGLVSFRFTGTLHAQFPLDNGASLDFFRIDEGGGQGYAHINIPNSIGAFAGTAIGYEGSYLYVSRLNPRVQVSQLRFHNSCDTTSSSGVKCFGAIIGLEGGTSGNFQEPGRGFIGFVFNTGAGNEYGWARIKTTGKPSYEFILVDYAWADPGDSIQTGQKKSEATGQAVPISGSLSLLATGATGLKAWRQQKASRTAVAEQAPIE